jgi:hypothetical protein
VVLCYCPPHLLVLRFVSLFLFYFIRNLIFCTPIVRNIVLVLCIWNGLFDCICVGVYPTSVVEGVGGQFISVRESLTS